MTKSAGAELPPSVMEMAHRFHLHIEDGEILHSEDQGAPSLATVCVDRWLSAKSGDIRMEVRLVQRSPSGAAGSDWQGQDSSLQSDPLTEEEALQLVNHWGMSAQEVMRLAQLAQQQERERFDSFGPRPR